MPSRSQRQARMMAAAANDPAVAKRLGVPRETAKEFHAADRAAGVKRLPEKASTARKRK